MNKIGGNQIDLESFTNDFFYKFSKYVEKNNRVKYFWRVIC